MLLTVLFTLFASYLYGSINIAVIISRSFTLPDPQKTGSKNPGTANMLRNAGIGPAAVTLAFDISKGLLPITLATLLELSELAMTLSALAGLLGHIFPLFHAFKGGKGVATALGMLVALNPWLGAVFVLVWISVAYVSRYASVASLTALLISVCCCVYMNANSIWVATGVFIIVVACHYQNMINLINHKENKLKL